MERYPKDPEELRCRSLLQRMNEIRIAYRKRLTDEQATEGSIQGDVFTANEDVRAETSEAGI